MNKTLWAVSIGILLTFLLSTSVWAEDLEVTADKFTHLESQNKAVFEGHAHATQGKSWINADKFVIFFDQNNTAKQYRAIGNVDFEIDRPQQHVKGKCQKLTYTVAAETYLAEGNATLNDLLNHRQMYGDEIFLDNLNRKASAKSNHKGPVKFIFQMKDAAPKKKKKK